MVLGAVATYSELKTEQEQKQIVNHLLDQKAAKGELTQTEANSLKYPKSNNKAFWVLFIIVVVVIILLLL